MCSSIIGKIEKAKRYSSEKKQGSSRHFHSSIPRGTWQLYSGVLSRIMELCLRVFYWPWHLQSFKGLAEDARRHDSCYRACSKPRLELNFALVYARVSIASSIISRTSLMGFGPKSSPDLSLTDSDSDSISLSPTTSM